MFRGRLDYNNIFEVTYFLCNLRENFATIEVALAFIKYVCDNKQICFNLVCLIYVHYIVGHTQFRGGCTKN